MRNPPLEALRLANREFPEFTEEICREIAKNAHSLGALRRLAKIHLHLRQVGASLPSTRALTNQPQAAYQTMKYRENLKSLRSALQTLQLALLTERNRLEQLRAHTEAASAWAASLREIS